MLPLAIDRTEAAIAQARRAGQPEIRFIVGKGMHSEGHKAKIKPAIVDLMQKCAPQGLLGLMKRLIVTLAA